MSKLLVWLKIGFTAAQIILQPLVYGKVCGLMAVNPVLSNILYTVQMISDFGSLVIDEFIWLCEGV